MTEKRQRGQMLLITILVLTVATTIALSLIGRATLDLSMSNQIEESTRAFNAAEAGIESALKTGQGGSATIATGTSFNVSVNEIGGTTGVYQLSHKTQQGVTETVWLVNHTDAGVLDETPFYTTTTLPICWSQPSAGAVKAALIISVLYKEGSDGSYAIARVAADPDAAVRNNNFDGLVSTQGCGLGHFETVLDFTALGITVSGVSSDVVLAVRMRPEYADASLAIDGGVLGVPKQGNVIESIGSTGTGVTRKVIVYQQYRAAASIFDSVIFSQSSFGH